MDEVSRILSQIERGDRSAADALLPLVYDELRRLARARLAQEQPGQTLQPTPLVHEAYLRLVRRTDGETERRSEGGTGSSSHPSVSPSLGPSVPSFDSRQHFFAAAAEAMRRILVEAARRKRRLKRGGALERQPLEDEALVLPEVDEDLIELDAALVKLAETHPRKAELVKLRYFAGLTQQEAADALEIGVSTADRDWAYARAWLFREVSRNQ